MAASLLIHNTTVRGFSDERYQISATKRVGDFPIYECPLLFIINLSFSEFYPFYLQQHANLTCRRLHVAGTSLALLTVLVLTLLQQWLLLPLALVIGYAFAWVGHFFFERNKPATFSYPLYSFIGDFIMLRDVLIGRIKI